MHGYLIILFTTVHVGIFDVDDSHLQLKICPRHRDDLGLRWKTSKIYCTCPSSWAPHKSTARKKDRGISLEHARILYVETTTVLPVGSRKKQLELFCSLFVYDLSDNHLNL